MIIIVCVPRHKLARFVLYLWPDFVKLTKLLQACTFTRSADFKHFDGLKVETNQSFVDQVFRNSWSPIS